ncbi:conjugal transfer protein [Rummeliibacillus pycnus]|uniref:conjugal transfer protein n=1 Tax=Rummeliibacillus pycnus TaxID=101070 RepID=UPI003D28BFCE
MKNAFKKAKVIGGNLNEISKQEKEKSDRKKKARKQSLKPKGFTAKKVGTGVFWCAFVFMLCFVVLNVLSNNNKTSASNNAEYKANKATSQEAVQYAIDFSKALYTFDNSEEGSKKHVSAISPYLMSSLPEDGGINVKDSKYSSKWLSSDVQNVEEIGQNMAQISLRVKTELTERKSRKTKPILNERYVTMAVAYDGDTFGIYELPKFSSPKVEKTTLSELQYKGLTNADVTISSAINEFLPTFFKVYMEDTKDKLDYMLLDSSLVSSGLNGSVKFKQIENSDVYKEYVVENEDKATKYFAFVTVSSIETSTGIEFDSNYQLTIVKKSGHFVVADFNELSDVNMNVTSSTDIIEDNTTGEITN